MTALSTYLKHGGRLARAAFQTFTRKNARPDPFRGMSALPGRCNICGKLTVFYFNDPALYRESLKCRECFSTSRYRSIARGLLEAVGLLAGVKAKSLAELTRVQFGLSPQGLRYPDSFLLREGRLPDPGFVVPLPLDRRRNLCLAIG